MNHDLKFTIDKGNKFLKILDKARYYNVFRYFPLLFSEGREENEAGYAPVERGFHWGGYDQYGWLKMNVTLPENFRGTSVAGLFDFGMTGLGGNSGFESLCYLNGKKYQGVDLNHQEVLLPADTDSFELKFMMWAGLDGGGNEQDINLVHEIKRCEFAILDEAVDGLFYLVKALLQTARQLDKQSSTRVRLLDLLNDTYNRVSLSSSVIDHAEAEEASRILSVELAKIREDNPDIVRCVGHTHIDLAWLWTLKHTREKAQRSFSTVLRLMERYPHYIFFQSQPQLYAWVKEDDPELFRQIGEKIAQNRWEAEGAMWVEADCLLTGGESLVRQLLYGKKFIREEFDRESEILWLPDVFGYTASLPQILKLADVNYFMTTKISWNQYNHIPNDTFNWKGIDGTEILTHFVNTPSSEDNEDLGSLDFYTYNGMINANSVNGIWKSYRNKGFSDEVLLSYGYGDGGGGVTRNMLEMVEKLDAIPSNPQVKTGFAKEFFQKLKANEKEKELNRWVGELYLEFHRGTYTSQSRTKRANRKLEYMLRNSELLSLLGDTSAYPADTYEGLWKELLARQFHDILPGSSITPVYKEAEATYARIGETLKAEQEKTLAALMSDEQGVSVFNTQSFAVEEIVFVEESRDGHYFDGEGKAVPCQKSLGQSGYFLKVSLMPFSFARLEFVPGECTPAAKGSGFTDLALETGRYRVEWNEKGDIVSLVGKSEGKERVPQGKAFNRLMTYEDRPRQFDAWELEPYYGDKAEPLGNFQSAELIEAGELLTTVRFTWDRNDSQILQNVTFYEHTDRIDFKTDVEWQERNTLLKTLFETEINSPRATFDIQFGNIERTTHRNTSWDFAQFEVPAQKWADLSRRGRGMALMNDCKYGYNVKEGTMGLSLLKSASVPDSEADRGSHSFTYAILPHGGDFYEARVELEALQLNNPSLVVRGKAAERKPFVSLDRDNVVVDSLKLSEKGDSLILRLHEYAGMESAVNLALGRDHKGWREVNLLERPLGESTRDAVSLNFKPYEIKTLEFFL